MGSRVDVSSRANSDNSDEGEVAIGQLLGRFQIVDRLGEGGMGVVYRARDEQLRRTVALKVLPAAVVRDEERRRRFLREARSAAAVSHANIATVYEVGEADGRVYIAMELVQGSTLRERVAAGALPFAEVLAIGREIARGLVEAHAAGVVHRDLKPENVVVSDGNHVKILDFGLAKLEEPEAEEPVSGDAPTANAHATEEGRILGTPGYMSPEQARGLPVDARSDLFALGIVLYELATGRRPFGGKTTMDLLMAISRDPAPAPSSLVPSLPRGFDALIARCLEKEPGARYATCRELLAAIDALAGGSAPARPRGRAPLIRAVLALIAAGVVAAIVVALLAARPGAPAARPTPLTDLPRPTGAKPESLAEYDKGMQLIRNGNWNAAIPRFRRAAEIDPSVGAYHLRYAVAGQFEAPGTVTQEAFRRAVELRGTLSERDQLFLDAHAPRLQQSPADKRAQERLIAEALRRFPLDAELHQTRCFTLMELSEPDAALPECKRATELDPSYSDPWQLQGRILVQLGRLDDAERALEACLQKVPSSNDCHEDLGGLRAVRGRCAEAEREIRQTVMASPGPISYRNLGGLLFALGRDGAARDLLAKSWRFGPEETLGENQQKDEILLSIHGADLAAAEVGLSEWERRHADDPNLWAHSFAAIHRVAIAEETGRPRDAEAAAARYLDHYDAWTGSSVSPIREDVSLVMGRARLRAGAIPPAAFEALRAEFLRRWRDVAGISPERLWLAAWARPAETREEAERALAQRPRPERPLVQNLFKEEAYVHYHAAKVDLLAGRVDRALPPLEDAAANCRAFEDPFEALQLQRYLAEAREAKGDTAGACAAWQRVIDRWGAAKPRSVTAERARERRRALGCR
jgi:eukaryotic-like serine/threonine-protein kinase